jgi:hypothetical protein
MDAESPVIVITDKSHNMKTFTTTPSQHRLHSIAFVGRSR